MNRRFRNLVDMTNYIPGVDRSHLNSPYPLAKLVAEGIQFGWFKACQYMVGEDKVFNASWQEAKNTPNFKRGAYCFFDPRYDGIEQCKFFLSLNINFLAEGCMGGAVDVEDLVVFDANGDVDHELTAQANQWVADNWQLALSRLNDFLNYFKQETTLDCLIYTYNGYFKEYFHSNPFPNSRFWISSLQATCPGRYDNGQLPQFWQNSYRWRGSDMDADFFTGTQEELNALANITA